MLRIRLVALFLVVAFAARSEDMPTLGLFELVYYSPTIFTAKPLPEDNVVLVSRSGGRHYFKRFVVEKVLRQDTTLLPDTVIVSMESYNFWHEWSVTSKVDGPNGVDFKTEYFKEKYAFDNFAFYGTLYQSGDYDVPAPIFYPFLSGIRPFKNDSAFTPVQPMNPGNYHFFPRPKIGWEEWVEKTKRAIARHDSVLALRKIRPFSAQNEAIFQWIFKNKNDLKRGGYNWAPEGEDRYWGALRWEIFEWINGNGIWQDAWRSSLLSQEVDSTLLVIKRPEDAPNPFLNPEARAFLMGQMVAPDGHKRLAINLLSESLWSWEDERNSISEAEQTRILQLAEPFLEDKNKNLQYGALNLIENAAIPSDYKDRHLRKTTPLPVLKKMLEQPLDEYVRREVVMVIERMERQ